MNIFKTLRNAALSVVRIEHDLWEHSLVTRNKLSTIISNQKDIMAAIDDVKHILEAEAAEIATIAQGVTALNTQLTATEAIVTDLEAKAAASTEDADLAEIATAARQNLTAMQSIAAQLPSVASTSASAGADAATTDTPSGN